ncbi:MAG: tetratricopeptide repeat protein [Thermoanaerobaculia bacterium]
MWIKKTWIGLVMLGGLSGALASLAQQGRQPTTQQVLAELDGRIAEARRAIDGDPSRTDLWSALLPLEMQRAHVRAVAEKEAGHFPAGQEDARVARASDEARDLVLAEWIRRVPDDPAPYLIRMNAYRNSPEVRLDLLRELATRYPDSLKPRRALVDELARQGDLVAARALVEEELERHPDRAEAYRMALDYYQLREPASPRMGAVLEAWKQHFPSDPLMLAAWVAEELAGKDPEASRAVAEEALAHLPRDLAAQGVCSALAGQDSLQAEAARCWLALLPAAQEASDHQNLVAQYAQAAGRQGSWQDVNQAMAGLDAAQRAGVIHTLALDLAGAGQCQGSLVVLSNLLALPATEAHFEAAGPTLAQCGTSPEALPLFLQLIARAPAEDLPSLVARGPAATGVGEVSEALRARLDQSPGEADVWRALDGWYQATRADAERRALLDRWLTADPEYHEPSRLVAWAELTVAAGGEEAARARLQELASRPGWDADWPSLQWLVALELKAGHAAAAEQAQRRFRQATQRDPARAPYSELLEARIATANGKPREALAAYERACQRPGPACREGRQEYLRLLVASGQRSRAVAFLTAEVEANEANGGNRGGRDLALASSLIAFGLAAEALPLYQQALTRNPSSAEILRGLATAAEQAGQLALAESALNSLAALPTEAGGGLGPLLDFFRRHGQTDRVLALARQAERNGESSPELELAAARSAMDREDWLTAIVYFRRLLIERGHYEFVREELHHAYRQLAQ